MQSKFSSCFSVVFLVFLASANANDFPRNYFISPVEFPLSLSANFGELRTNAFHAGIDIRTGGVTGKRVLAAAEGFVYRIRVSPVGYGRALYIEHPNGLATVYAHLDQFNEEIEEYVKQEQYRQQSFDVDLVPPRGRLKVRQGELIGYSGNTGSSGGPHLHFEIREASTQKIINPLLFNFDVRDDLPPVLYTLAVYPLNQNSLVNGRNEPLYLPLTGGRGRYRVRGNEKPEVYGDIGFGIEVIDFLNNSGFRCGAWSIEKIAGDRSVYRHELTKLSFGEMRYLNSHIDYAERIRNRRDIQRTFLQPNNRLDIYTHQVNRGISSFLKEEETEISIIVEDVYKNRSELAFSVQTIPPATTQLAPPAPPDHFAMLMSYDRQNTFSAQGLRISMPANILYEDLLFEYSLSDGPNGSIAPVHNIHNRYTPVHGNYNLSIEVPELPSELRNKALIVNLNNNNNSPAPLTSRWQNGFIHAQPNVLGRFTVMLDTVPPVIQPINFRPGRDMGGQRMISFRIEDDLSGIRSYAGFIDDEWALFEYDPKNNHLFYVFDEARIGRGRNRKLRLYIMDQKENLSVYSAEFFY